MDQRGQPMPDGDQDEYRPIVGQPTQSTPRKRSTIACNNCRRRKIRCSGTEDFENARCFNCARSNQECIFTAFSSQPLVPAQALWGHQNDCGQLPKQPLGASGQLISPSVYLPNQLPRSEMPYPQPVQQYVYQNQPYPLSSQQSGPEPDHRREHSATLPLPNSTAASYVAGYPASGSQVYLYSDQTSYYQDTVSPAISLLSHLQQPYGVTCENTHNPGDRSIADNNMVLALDRNSH